MIVRVVGRHQIVWLDFSLEKLLFLLSLFGLCGISWCCWLASASADCELSGVG